MVIFYVNRIAAKNADVTYNIPGEGLWIIAEVSFGLIVTCTFSLPKFIEAEGTKLRGVLSSLTRPFTTLTSLGSFESRMHAKKGKTASPEVFLDRIVIGHLESDVSSSTKL